jgi:uracil-DNA glycosylase
MTNQALKCLNFSMILPPLETSWQELLADDLQSPYFQELLTFLLKEEKSGKIIYPLYNEIFTALNLTPFSQVKVVILGQDPYHGPAQAHGLCFSVRPGIKAPPSLVNIFKELQNDLGISPPKEGCLEQWARQGVLLLNNVLTVEAAKAASHHNQGWERFTDKIIQLINEKKENVVFILWGSPAQKKAAIVDESKHFVIKSVHPSPLSSYRGFFGSRPFSRTNDYLKSTGQTLIDWRL